MSATNRGAKRNKNDFYPTPEYCVEAIFNEVNLDPALKYLEPCRGDGVIYKRFPGKRLYAELSEGIDYMENQFIADVIVTNPPFSLALPFLLKSLNEAGTVIYLLRLNFLGSKKRREFWQKNRPSHLFIHAERPSFSGDGSTDATEYAWFVWDRLHICKRPPGIYVI